MADSIVWTSINLQKSASIGTVTKNTEMLKFAPDHLKTTKCDCMLLSCHVRVSE